MRLVGVAVMSRVGYPEHAMVRESEIREGELAVEMPPAQDAGLIFIGRIRTPWTSRLMTPRQGRHDGPVCRLEISNPGCRRSRAWISTVISR